MSKYNIKKKKHTDTTFVIKSKKDNVELFLHFGSEGKKILDGIEKPAKDYYHRETALVFEIKCTTENYAFLQKKLDLELEGENSNSTKYVIVTGRRKKLRILAALKQELKTEVFEPLKLKIEQQFLAERPLKTKHINAYNIVEEKRKVDGRHGRADVITEKSTGKTYLLKKVRKRRKNSEIEATMGALFRILLVSNTPQETTAVYDDTGYVGVASQLIANAKPLKRIKNMQQQINQGLLRIMVAAYILEENDLHLYNILYDLTAKLYKIDHDCALWGYICQYYKIDPENKNQKWPAPLKAIPINASDIKYFPELDKAYPSNWPIDSFTFYDVSPEREREKYKWFLNAILIDPLLYNKHIEANLGSPKAREKVKSRIQQRLNQLETILLELPEFQTVVLENPALLTELIAEYKEFNEAFEKEDEAFLQIDVDTVKRRYSSFVAKIKFDQIELLYRNQDTKYLELTHMWFDIINQAILFALNNEDTLLLAFKEKIQSDPQHPAKNYLLSALYYLGLGEKQNIKQARDFSMRLSRTALNYQTALFDSLLIDNDFDIKNSSRVIASHIKNLLAQQNISKCLVVFNQLQSKLSDKDKNNIILSMCDVFDSFLDACMTDAKLLEQDDSLWFELAKFYENLPKGNQEKIYCCHLMSTLTGNRKSPEALTKLEPVKNISINKLTLKIYLTQLEKWISGANSWLKHHEAEGKGFNPFWNANRKKEEKSVKIQIVFAYEQKIELTSLLKSNDVNNWVTRVEKYINHFQWNTIPSKLKINFQEFQEDNLKAILVNQSKVNQVDDMENVIKL